MMLEVPGNVRPHANSFDCRDEDPLIPEPCDRLPQLSQLSGPAHGKSQDSEEASTRTPSPSWSTRSMYGGPCYILDEELGGMRLPCGDSPEDPTSCGSTCFTIPTCLTAHAQAGPPDVLTGHLSQLSTRTRACVSRFSSKTKARTERAGVLDGEDSRELLLRRLEACALPERPEAASFDVHQLSDSETEEKGQATKQVSRDASISTVCSPSDVFTGAAIDVSERSRQRRRQMEMQKDEVLQAFLTCHNFGGVDEPCHGRMFWSEKETVYPIHVASQMGNYEVVRKLIVARANPRQKTSRLRTALDLALEAADAESAETHHNVIDLLKGGIEVMSFRDLRALA